MNNKLYQYIENAIKTGEYIEHIQIVVNDVIVNTIYVIFRACSDMKSAKILQGEHFKILVKVVLNTETKNKHFELPLTDTGQVEACCNFNPVEINIDELQEHLQGLKTDVC